MSPQLGGDGLFEAGRDLRICTENLSLATRPKYRTGILGNELGD